MKDKTSKSGCFKGFCLGCIFSFVIILAGIILLIFYRCEIKRYIVIKSVSYIETSIVSKTESSDDKERLENAFEKFKDYIRKGDWKIDLGEGGLFIEKVRTALDDGKINEREAEELVLILENIRKGTEKQVNLLEEDSLERK